MSWNVFFDVEISESFVISRKMAIFVILSVSKSKTIKVSELDFQIRGLAIYITFIYPRQCYSTSASGAEQTTETNHL